jgi:hypothetical protein
VVHIVLSYINNFETKIQEFINSLSPGRDICYPKSKFPINRIALLFGLTISFQFNYAQVSAFELDTLPVVINSNSILILTKPHELIHFNNKTHIDVIKADANKVQSMPIPELLKNNLFHQHDIRLADNEIYVKNNKGKIVKNEISLTNKWEEVKNWPEGDLLKIFLKNGQLYLHNAKTKKDTKIKCDLDLFTINNNKLQHKTSSIAIESNQANGIPAHDFIKDSIYYLDAHSFQDFDNTFLFKIGLCLNCIYIINNDSFVNEYFLGDILSANIVDSLLYVLEYNNYTKINLSDNSIVNVPLNLPTNTFNYIKSANGYYFIGKNSFFVDVHTGKIMVSEKYKVAQNIKQLVSDDFNYYVLTNSSLYKINRKSFDLSLVNYDAKQFEDDSENYYSIVNELTNDTICYFPAYYRLIMQIDNTFKDLLAQTNATDHLTICHACLSSSSFMENLKNHLFYSEVDPRFLNVNYFLIVKNMIEQGNLKDLIKLDFILKNKYKSKLNFLDVNRINSTIDSVKVYLELEKQLEKSISDSDSLDLEKILKLDIVYNSSLFCHEGCGGCDYQAIAKRLKKYYYSHRKYKDKVEYYLITIENHSFEGAYTEKDRRTFENFLRRWPNSKYYPEIAHQLIDYHQYTLDYDPESKINKDEIVKLCRLIKDKYPEYFQKHDLNYWLTQYGND